MSGGDSTNLETFDFVDAPLRCFYSRKSFFFPERQTGVHKDWRDEVNFLDSVFGELLKPEAQASNSPYM